MKTVDLILCLRETLNVTYEECRSRDVLCDQNMFVSMGFSEKVLMS